MTIALYWRLTHEQRSHAPPGARQGPDERWVLFIGDSAGYWRVALVRTQETVSLVAEVSDEEPKVKSYEVTGGLFDLRGEKPYATFQHEQVTVPGFMPPFMQQRIAQLAEQVFVADAILGPQPPMSRRRRLRYWWYSKRLRAVFGVSKLLRVRVEWEDGDY